MRPRGQVQLVSPARATFLTKISRGTYMLNMSALKKAWLWNPRPHSCAAQVHDGGAAIYPIPPDNAAVVANVDDGPIFDQRLPEKAFGARSGPYTTFTESCAADSKSETGRKLSPAYYVRELVSFHNQPWPRPTFTHGDLSSLNIMARSDEGNRHRRVNPRNRFWRDEVDKFLTPSAV